MKMCLLYGFGKIFLVSRDRLKNIAVFASGNGSNFEAIATAVKSGKINAIISLLVCDNPEAMVITRAEKLAYPLCN